MIKAQNTHCSSMNTSAKFGPIQQITVTEKTGVRAGVGAFSIAAGLPRRPRSVLWSELSF